MMIENYRGTAKYGSLWFYVIFSSRNFNPTT